MTNPNPVVPKTAREKGSADPDIPYCEQDDYEPEVGIDICAHGLPFCDECEECEDERDFEDEDGNYAGENEYGR